MKYVFLFGVITLATFASGKPCCYAYTSREASMDPRFIAEVLNKSLKTLAALDGPFYKLVRINFATRHMVSGMVDRINADLKDQDDNIKTCDVEIWSKLWMKNGITVTFNCPGEKELVRTHSA